MEKAIREKIKRECEMNGVKKEGIVLFLDEFKGEEICEENYVGGTGYRGSLEEVIEKISDVNIDKSYKFRAESAHTEKERGLKFKFIKGEKIILIDISKRLAN